MSKFLYPIYKLNIESYKKWWLYHKKAGGSGILSEILEGFSFNLADTLNRKFKLFEIEGNSTQDGTPSPDNEVPIKSAGDNENEFNPELAEDKKYQNIDGNYSIATHPLMWISGLQSIESSQSYILNHQAQTGAFYDENRNVIKSSPIYQSNTFQTPSNAKYVNLTFAPSIVTFDDKDNIKLEKGNKASGYSPYGMGSINQKITNSDGTKEQDYSIFVQQPMRSIGDVRDCFVKKSDGKLYERHYFNLTDLGDYNWSPVNQNENSRTQGLFMSWSLKNIENYSSSATTIPKLLSNKYISKPNYKYQAYGRNPQNYTISTYGGEILYIQNSDFSGYTNEQAKEAMAGTILQYPRETPLDLPCTETQIQQLENLPSTYKDFTIIQSQDETEAYLKIQYWKEVQS